MAQPSRKIDRWAKQLATGGAEDFFRDFPNDSDLAAKLNETFAGDGIISEEQVKLDRRRFAQLPRRSANRKKVELASPTKDVIRNKASQIDVKEAIAEILDNIFDNFERSAPSAKSLSIEIEVYPNTESVPAEIIFIENSGGIPQDRLLPLIQLGASDRAGRGIGAWGEGFKMAGFALGKEIEVFTSFPGDDPFAIHFPLGWMDEHSPLWTEWKVEIYGVEEPPNDGTTVIRIKNLNDDVMEFFGFSDGRAPSTIRNLARYFGELYAEKVSRLTSNGNSVNIGLSYEGAVEGVEFLAPVEQRLKKTLAFIPWLPPIRWDVEWKTHLDEVDQDVVLRARIYAGLNATEGFKEYSPMDGDGPPLPGVEMWGNGRKFSLKGMIRDESVGWSYIWGGSAGTNPASGASYRRLLIVVLFESEDSRFVPWAAPVKNDFNRRSEFYKEIQETLAYAIRLYKDGARILEGILAPYSARWGAMANQPKLDSLFKDTSASPNEVSTFGDGRFGGKLLNYSASLTFKNLVDAKPTTNSAFGIPSARIATIAQAAAESKASLEQRIQFLKAIFRTEASQAEIEEKLGLTNSEVFAP